ncbi:biotin--[acetyl-CoA-carboxylase] ligase [Chelativorans sp. AA-79]|uniref:biotin--[acetyl-CoA-carboxylase] ligase n=1 Tax=Chelativorans sp. AA-79 TaxID=3028735 RepID=UPI0023F862CB|nr:biotin--[acetyl-CoA-carboxylase] ligase [Chelativorans sp. AA-79]WEX07546.1 biotin--[acetyl-CoA-carboxylase] ligase [Chelativorans sp. AA-79]
MFALAPSALAAGYRLEAHESVGSTNALALERAAAGDDPGNLWIVSKDQTSGRGRRGRVWATPPGNLAATLLLVDRIEPGMAAILGFVAGLSLSDALRAVAPQARIGIGVDGGEERRQRSRFELKWPNDVLADGAKLAGILLESSLLGDGRFAVAVGIGVNIVVHPADLPYPATSLQALGVDCDAERLFMALSSAWVENFTLWKSPDGTAAIRERWLSQAAGLGSEVSVRADGRVVRGVFETIDELCRFVIREDDGSRLLIAAGDVHFGAVASVRA